MIKRELEPNPKGNGCMRTIYTQVKNSDKKIVRITMLIDKHDCGIEFDNRLVTTPWLMKNFLELFRLNPSSDYESFKT